MKTGRHQNEDGLGCFGGVHVIKMKTSLLTSLLRLILARSIHQPISRYAPKSFETRSIFGVGPFLDMFSAVLVMVARALAMNTADLVPMPAFKNGWGFGGLGVPFSLPKSRGAENDI